ncbi:spermidine synthase (putrescine aminopropyltransferase) [Bifidobacterium adolescentis ATCC 15703]|uniref:Spermidine synthase (Putrescine aminopropyltransferase) n=1 Tax=Bifidobacterium adolescentis (strain ATCC 15703 / DSM 20083 / NCTC 11814 / E194a) TaxID=367928 RepID=A1A2W9_BIFAA|nr:spermidine synthase (putrescine aminopropyltransferase) [Bifidobacterium adolescentis ATCC 15703]
MESSLSSSEFSRCLFCIRPVGIFITQSLPAFLHFDICCVCSEKCCRHSSLSPRLPGRSSHSPTWSMDDEFQYKKKPCGDAATQFWKFVDVVHHEGN